MEELITAATALQFAVADLGGRLVAYPEGTYDDQIAAATFNITQVTNAINAMAPTPEGRALELTAVG